MAGAPGVSSEGNEGSPEQRAAYRNAAGGDVATKADIDAAFRATVPASSLAAEVNRATAAEQANAAAAAAAQMTADGRATVASVTAAQAAADAAGTAAAAKIPLAQRGAANGVAVLDADGRVASPLPLSVGTRFDGLDATDVALGLQIGANTTAIGTKLDKTDPRASNLVLPARSVFNTAFVRRSKVGVALLGDSKTANNYTETTTGTPTYGAQFRADGWWVQAQTLLRHRTSTQYAGISGNDTGQMLARMDADVLAYRPDVLIVDGGTNDVRGGQSYAFTTGKLQAIYERAIAFGVTRIVATTIMPAADATSDQRKNGQRLNRWIRAYCLANPRHMVLCDWYPRLVNQDGSPIAAYFDAIGVHPTPQGALVCGKAMAEVLDPLLPIVDPLVGDNVYDEANIVGNGMMTGQIGSTGVASSWTVAGGATWSKVARTDGVVGDWQQASVPSGGISELRKFPTGWSVGDMLQAACEFETDPTGWVDGPMDLIITCLNSSNALLHTAAAMSIISPYTTSGGRIGSGVLTTPAIVVPANTATVKIAMRKDNAGTIRWSRASLSRLNTI